MAGWMNGWVKNFTRAHAEANILHACWDRCVAFRISMQPGAIRSISTALALMYKPSFPATPSPLCLTIISMTGRLIEHGRASVRLLPRVCPCIWACRWLCLCSCVCTPSWDICSFEVWLADCTMRLEFSNIKGPRQNLMAVLSSSLIVVLLNCFIAGGCVCLLYGLTPTYVTDKCHLAPLLFFSRQADVGHGSICRHL